ncbi:hypothetical protein QJQ45_011409 [Haematococcus lacustris]|nr:hypothetical protein QJQ45_011409 [Haematococcus lacustris]
MPQKKRLKTLVSYLGSIARIRNSNIFFALLALTTCLALLLQQPRLGSAQMDRDKLAKMAGAVRTGGKGTVRRKKKAIHKTTTTDDKRLQNTLKKLGVNTIPGIEEVNIFKDDSEVVHFQNPKELQDLLPGILNQMGPDSIQHLKKMMQQLTGGMGMPGLNSMGGPGSFPGIQSAPEGQDAEDDDDVPDLVENFEDAAKA